MKATYEQKENHRTGMALAAVLAVEHGLRMLPSDSPERILIEQDIAVVRSGDLDAIKKQCREASRRWMPYTTPGLLLQGSLMALKIAKHKGFPNSGLLSHAFYCVREAGSQINTEEYRAEERTEFQELFVSMYLACPEHKKEKWDDFVIKNTISVPSDFAFIPPAPDGINEKWNLSGSVKIRIPEDEKRLEVFDRIAPGYTEKIKKFDNGKFANIVDAKLGLTLLATDSKTFSLTRYYRGPRRPKESK